MTHANDNRPRHAMSPMQAPGDVEHLPVPPAGSHRVRETPWRLVRELSIHEARTMLWQSVPLERPVPGTCFTYRSLLADWQWYRILPPGMAVCVTAIADLQAVLYMREEECALVHHER